MYRCIRKNFKGSFNYSYGQVQLNTYMAPHVVSHGYIAPKVDDKNDSRGVLEYRPETLQIVRRIPKKKPLPPCPLIMPD